MTPKERVVVAESRLQVVEIQVDLASSLAALQNVEKRQPEEMSFHTDHSDRNMQQYKKQVVNDVEINADKVELTNNNQAALNNIVHGSSASPKAVSDRRHIVNATLLLIILLNKLEIMEINCMLNVVLL